MTFDGELQALADAIRGYDEESAVEALPAWRCAKIVHRTGATVRLKEHRGTALGPVDRLPIVVGCYSTVVYGPLERFHPSSLQVGAMHDGMGVVMTALRRGSPHTPAYHAIMLVEGDCIDVLNSACAILEARNAKVEEMLCCGMISGAEFQRLRARVRRREKRCADMSAVGWRYCREEEYAAG